MTMTASGKVKATPELRAQARDLFDKGESKAAIARKLNLHHGTVDRWMPIENSRDPDRQAAIKELRDQGWTYQAIGERYGISKQAVAQLLGPRRTVAKGVNRQINLAQERWDALREKAHLLGLVYADGSPGGRGNVPMLLDAIARGDLDVRWAPGKGGLSE